MTSASSSLFFILCSCFLAHVIYRLQRVLGIFDAPCAEKCKPISDIDSSCFEISTQGKAPEDIRFIDNRWAIATNFDIRQSKTHGAVIDPYLPIKLVDTKSKSMQDIQILDWPEGVGLRTHGMAVRDGIALFVNHAAEIGGERIEIFKIDNKKTKPKLKYLKSVTSDIFPSGSINSVDILWVSGDEVGFFATKYSKSSLPPTPIGELLETLRVILGFPKLKSVYCTSMQHECTEVGSAVGAWNGMALNQDQTRLLAVDMSLRHLYLYEVEGNNLKLLTKISQVPHHIDNIVFSEYLSTNETDVWTTAGVYQGIDFLKLTKVIKHDDFTNEDLTELPSVTMTVSIDRSEPNKNSVNVDRISSNRGWTSCSLSPDGNKELIGTFLEPKLVMCLRGN